MMNFEMLDKQDNIILFYGEEDYIFQKWLSLQKSKMKPELLDMHFHQFANKQLQLDLFEELLETLPMQGEVRLIVVEDDQIFHLNQKQHANQLIDILKSMGDHAKVVFHPQKLDKRNVLYKYIKNNHTIVQLTRLNEVALRSYVKDKALELGICLPKDSLSYFVKFSGYLEKDSMINLMDINNYLKKLQGLEKKQIQTEDIENQIIEQNISTIFQLVDHVFSGDEVKAMSILHQLFDQKVSSMQMIAFLQKEISIMLKTLYLSQFQLSESLIAKQLEVHPYRVKKAKGRLRKWNKQSLIPLMVRMIDYEYLIKTGQLQEKVALELAITQITSTYQKIDHE